MNRLRQIQLLVVTVATVAGVLLFLVVVPITSTNTAPLATTIFSSPNVPSLKSTPIFTGALPVAQMSNAAMAEAGLADPVHTGAWAKQWGPPTPKGTDNLDIQVAVTANAAVAKKVQEDENTSVLAKGAITAAKHTYHSQFSLAPLAGTATSYEVPAVHTPATASLPAVNTAAEPGYAMVYRVDRAVVQINFVGLGVTRAVAVAVANREAEVVSAAVPKLPALQVRHNPIGSSALFIIVALAVVALLGLVPPAAVALRKRRAAERAARADRHRRVRGAKVMKARRF